MSSDTKRHSVSNKVPVALPKADSTQPNATLVSQEISLQSAIGARVRISTSNPHQSTIEGTVYTADPITNLLVLNISPATQTTTISSSSLTAPAGSYKILPISQITSFQILNLPQSTSTISSDAGLNNSLNTAALEGRLHRAIVAQHTIQARQGPKGTTPSDQALFDALSRTHPAQWAGNSMLISDTYLIEKPYHAKDVKFVEGRHGDLERMRKVVEMERSKVALRVGKGVIDGRMGNNPTGTDIKAAGGKKGG